MAANDRHTIDAPRAGDLAEAATELAGVLAAALVPDKDGKIRITRKELRRIVSLLAGLLILAITELRS